MKTPSSQQSPRNLDKHLFEAGLQCPKRLWLDYHEPTDSELSPMRQAMSATGLQLLELARSVFPKGTAVGGKSMAKAIEATTGKLAEGNQVLFGASFEADGVEVQSDILVQHKDGQVDLYEVKSGTRIKQRYINDLALQVHVVEACGHTVRAAFLLHVNPKYVHKEGADYPPMQLLRSADVTAKVRKQVTQVQSRLPAFRTTLGDRDVLALPMGTFCTEPFACPHLGRCSAEGPQDPLRSLPELSRAQEAELHQEGIEDLASIDPKRPGLTFKQRRTLTSRQQQVPITEPFVREELRTCTYPLHFLAIAALTEPLPKYEGQRPWRHVPYAFAAQTLYKDGRVESTHHVHAEKGDPRPGLLTALAKHLEIGGTILCWDDVMLASVRELLEDLPASKVAVRGVLSRPQVDMKYLFDAGVFHPQLLGHDDLVTSAAALLGDAAQPPATSLAEPDLRDMIEKASAPRVRSTTREKIAGEIQAALQWRCERLLALFRKFAELDAPARRPTAPAIVKKAIKALPKPLPGQ